MKNIGALHRSAREVFAYEIRFILRDPGVILILFAAVILYSTLYSFVYKNEVVRNLPVAVIDSDFTPSSRAMVRSLNATQNLQVAFRPGSMSEAEALLMRRKIYGIFFIPPHYEQQLLRGEQVVIPFYVDGGYFLMYRQIFSDAVGAIGTEGAKIELLQLLAGGASVPVAQTLREPVTLSVSTLYNRTLGYGTYLIPIVLIVILQQTLLMSLGLIGGTWRERGLYHQIRRAGADAMPLVWIVLVRAVPYLIAHSLSIAYLLLVHYPLFQLPSQGDGVHLIAILLPFLLATIFLGITLSTLFRYRENALLFLFSLSIPILMLSGWSVPDLCFPDWMRSLSKIFPSTPAIDAFLRLQTAGVGFDKVHGPFLHLWVLAGIYYLTACAGMYRLIRSPKATSDPADESLQIPEGKSPITE